MKKSAKFFLFFCLEFCLLSGFAQQNQKKVICSGENYEQFDFWEGNWNVYDTNGKLIGTNKLVKMQNNCVLQENWESKTSPNKGSSYNYFDKNDGFWHQVWIDNTGSVLNLKGKLIDGKMVLKSDVVTSQKGKYINRITWSKNEDGSVTQVWDYLNEKNEKMAEVFRGIYKKQ